MTDFQSIFVEFFIGVVFLAIAVTSDFYLRQVGKRAHPLMRTFFALVGVSFIIHGWIAMSHFK
jgi:succinate dehydrogenase hydrophobic anchor subunit